MRLRKKKWAIELIENNIGKYVITKDMLQNNEIFNNDQDINLEIGTGKGGFIVSMARKNLNTRFIGIEQNNAAFALCLKKILEQETEIFNLYIMNEDVNEVIDEIKDSSITTIYLNFSDPWPKVRHNKRRLTYPTILKKYERIMKKNAKIVFKTDNQLLFNDSVEYFKSENWVLESVDYDYQLVDIDVMTEYEAKFRCLGQKIYRLEAKKGE